MELTSQQRDTLMKEVAQEAGWAKIELPEMVANKPEAVNTYHEALKEASLGDKYPDWSKAMQLETYDSNRHAADLEKARTLQTQGAYLAERSDDKENRYHLTIDQAKYGAELPKFAAEHSDRSLVSIYRDEINAQLQANRERYDRLTERYKEVGHQGPGLLQVRLAYESQTGVYSQNMDAANSIYDRAHKLDKAREADLNTWNASMKSLTDLSRPSVDKNHSRMQQEPSSSKQLSTDEIEKMKVSALDNLYSKTGDTLKLEQVEIAKPGKSYSGEIIMKEPHMIAQYDDIKRSIVIHNGYAMDSAEKSKLKEGEFPQVNYSPGGNAVVHAREQELQHQGREAARNMESSRDLERGR